MRKSLAGGLFLILIVAAIPVGASCLDDPRIHSGASALWTDEYFDVHGYSPYGYGPYSFGGYAFTPNVTGFFWALGSGVPAAGSGVDSGDLVVSAWTLARDWPEYQYYTARPVDADWSQPGIDGCIDEAGATSALDGDECVAAVVIDYDHSSTHPFTKMAVMSVQVDGSGVANFERPGAHLPLLSVPKPPITNTVKVQPSSVRIWTGPPPPPVGTYVSGSCPDVIVGYRIYTLVQSPIGEQPPSPVLADNDWELVTDGAGPDGTRPADEAFDFVVDCTEPSDIYLAIQWVFDSGYETPYVSNLSSRIKCAEGCFNYDLDPSCEPFDCDNLNPDVYPYAPQICDGLNNDCADPSWPAPVGDDVDADLDGYPVCAGDCDDGDDLVSPGRAESCNGIDDNCDGRIDEDPLGLDTDLDTVGDSCDNCADVPDPSQADFDADLEGNVCDLDDGVLHAWFDGAGGFDWQDESGLGPWNVYRGDLAALRSTGVYTQTPGANPAADRFCDLPATGMADGWIPASGSFAFYLVTGDLSGVEIDLGPTGAGVPRTNTNPCP